MDQQQANPYKYLSDGRKVVVIGQLNNQETIVQEIFITAQGDEIPSGERFVVKSLHDEPVESYQSREEKRLKERCAELDKRIEVKNRELSEITHALMLHRKRLSATDKLVKNLPEKEIQTFTMFLTGTMEYIVRDGYTLQEPERFRKSGVDNCSYNKNDLKLLSVFGNSNGDLEYRINQYSDSSGGSWSIIPCASYDDALETVKTLAMAKIEKGTFSVDDEKVCKKLAISFPESALDKYREARKKTLQDNITYNERQIESQKRTIEIYMKEIEEING